MSFTVNMEQVLKLQHKPHLPKENTVHDRMCGLRVEMKTLYMIDKTVKAVH